MEYKSVQFGQECAVSRFEYSEGYLGLDLEFSVLESVIYEALYIFVRISAVYKSLILKDLLWQSQ